MDPLEFQWVKMEDTSNEPSKALAEIKEITCHKIGENTSVNLFMNCEM